MNSLHYLVIEVDSEYNNELTLGGVNIISNNTTESVANINRQVKVVSSPAGLIINPGDEIIIHHNILRTVLGYAGQRVYSEYWIKDNLYYLPPTEVFAYKRNDKWTAISPFCFLKPIEAPESNEIILSNQESYHKGNVKQRGSVWLTNDELEAQGVKVGDTCIMKPYSEYEFEIDGEIYYKMSTRDIVAVLK